jgi:hypothetical protein
MKVMQFTLTLTLTQKPHRITNSTNTTNKKLKQNNC